uniref:Uncharacterized protein n=1 Tax=Amphimedon queenslandica TaxID=400682 RepID=A0A1X7VHA8_AMPQE
FPNITVYCPIHQQHPGICTDFESFSTCKYFYNVFKVQLCILK